VFYRCPLSPTVIQKSDELPGPFRRFQMLGRANMELCGLAKKLQMQGAPEDDTGSVHGRTLRMAAKEQRRRWTF